MFENVGRKLKSISVVLFWIEMIATLITGIVVWSVSYDLGFLWFLIIAVGGGIYAYISTLMMYALGEAAEKPSTLNSIPREQSADYWKCSNCGKLNHKTAGTCGCGTSKSN